MFKNEHETLLNILLSSTRNQSRKATSSRTIFAQCETQYFQLLQQVIKARGRLIGSSSPFCPKMYRQKILLIWGTQLASASNQYPPSATMYYLHSISTVYLAKMKKFQLLAGLKSIDINKYEDVHYLKKVICLNVFLYSSFDVRHCQFCFDRFCPCQQQNLFPY